MQAPLSSTASGKHFHSESSSVGLPFFSAEVDLRTPELDSGSHPLHLISKSLVADEVGLAHDAGNLLHALGLYCELLAGPGVLREEHSHYARELQIISTRSRELMERLLSPGTTGLRATRALPRLQEHVVVPEVIEQCRGLLDMIARRAVEVAYEAGATLPVAVSQASLERILVNLTKNAAEASRGLVGASEILLRVSCQRDVVGVGRIGGRDRIVLSVEDKGHGMSSAAVKVMLGEGVKREGPHGIGFRVVRELVGASGGKLQLRSRTGNGESGTTVEISWAVGGGTGLAEARSSRQRLPLRLLEPSAPRTVSDGNGTAKRGVQC